MAWKLKQVLVGAQHKLVIYGDSSLVFGFLFVVVVAVVFFFFLLVFFFFFPSSVVSDAAYTKIIVVLLTEYHSVIAKKLRLFC